MTTRDLQPLIGLEVLWSTAGLEILVRIDDAKRSYGHTTYLITPASGGTRSMWVRSGLALPTKGA